MNIANKLNRDYEEIERNVGDRAGGEVTNRNLPLIREMLGDESDGRLNSFLDGQDTTDYEGLEQDSAASIFNKFNQFKNDNISELRNEYRANSKKGNMVDGINLAEKYEESLNNIIGAEGGRLNSLYGADVLDKHSGIFDGMKMMEKFGSNQEEFDRNINEAKDKWQNKLYGR